MRCELYDYQKRAVFELANKMKDMQDDWHRKGRLSSVALTAPTGAGKTVIMSAVIEGLFFGLGRIQPDSNTVILWLSDNPALNRQTMYRFKSMSDGIKEENMVEINPDFAKSFSILDYNKIYFLNRQKLVGNLGKATEGGRTFWDVLRDTIEDPSINLYLIIDEAHKGLGKSGENKSTTDEQNKTIYAKLIDGQKGLNPPMPVVIGISATIFRWDENMKSRKERIIMPSVDISNEDVRKVGIIKKLIELRSPDVSSNIKEQDLFMACRKLREFTKHWKVYCEKNNEKIVIPLMVVQVEDKITNDTLNDICNIIKSAMPELDTKIAFAHVFSEHEDKGNEFYNIPYISPEVIQEKTNIRILFAKDAISTGWDCPRAEVLYSRRKRQDITYIHQMFGRMIRTPLARSIESDNLLNSVVCYLPEYNINSVNEIVELIKNDGGVLPPPKVTKDTSWYSNIKDITLAVINYINNALKDGKLSTKFSFNKVEDIGMFKNKSNLDSVEQFITQIVNNNIILPNGIEENIANKTISVDIEKLSKVIDNMPKTSNLKDKLLKESFEGIVTRYVEKTDKDEFSQFFKVVNFLVGMKSPGTGESWENDEVLKDEFCKSIEYAISLNQEKFDESFKNVVYRKQHVVTIDYLGFKNFKKLNNSSTDLKDIENNFVVHRDEPVKIQPELFKNYDKILYKNCVNCFNSDYVNSYIIYQYDKNNMEEDDAVKRLVAVICCDEIMLQLSEWALKKANELIVKHDSNKGRLDAKNLAIWDKIVGNVQNWVEKNISVPIGVAGQNKLYETYKKHLICTSNGLAYLKLNDLEKYVVNKETSNEYNIAWYRNPSYVSNNSLAIPYRVGKDELKNFFPDFIFFEETNDGRIIRNIVDPHGEWMSDSVPRLEGYIEYLKNHYNDFAKVLVITKIDNEYRYLDLKNHNVIKLIKEFKGSSARELFKGSLSRLYE